MARSRWLAGLLLLVLCVTAGAQSFSDAKKGFESAFRPEKRFGERIDAVFAVSNFETRDAAKLLISGAAMTDALLAPIYERKGEVDEEIERTLGPKMMDAERTLPSAVHARIRTLKRETARLQDEIDGELKVFQAIEDGLAAMRSPEVVEYLAKSVLLRGKVWRTRQIAAKVLGEIGAPSTSKQVVRALRDKDARVLVAAAQAVGKMGLKEALKDLLALLKEKSWTVRSAAIEALGGIGVKEAVGPLIDQLEKEEGRLQRDCATALARLTGEDLGPIPSAWRRWWEDHKEEYGGEDGKELGGHPAAPAGGRDGGYYGIPIETKRAIFVLDVSGSMAKSAKDSSRGPQGGEVSKIESAKAELIRALKTFPSSGKFNVVIFNDIVKRWKEKMVPSNAAMKKDIEGWIKGLEAASSTNIYDALDSAFRLTGMGARDKNYDLGADTIFLLSDGSPTKPDGTADDWEKILRAVNEWNRLKRVVIHTIGIGGHNAAFMSRLARENGGTYVAR